MIRYRTRTKGVVVGVLGLAGAACLGPGDITGDQDDPQFIGTVVVVTITTGPGADPNGYLAMLNEGLSQPIEANGTVTFGAVPIGTHDVRLEGVDVCMVTTTNPIHVVLTPDTTVTAQFEVNCP